MSKKEITLKELHSIMEDLLVHYIGKMNTLEIRLRLTDEITLAFNQYTCPEADIYEFDPVVLPYVYNSDFSDSPDYRGMTIRIFKNGAPF